MMSGSSENGRGYDESRGLRRSRTDQYSGIPWFDFMRDGSTYLVFRHFSFVSIP